MLPGALLLGTLALLLALMALRAFAGAPVASVRKGVFAGALLLGLGVAGLLLATGRGGQLVWGLALVGPVLWQWWRGRRMARRFAGGGDAQESRVATATLEMTLDHATGRMRGQVLSGRFAGAALETLDRAALLELLGECRGSDPDAVPLLEAWLDRADPDWRQAPPGAGQGPMTRAEALAILGLAEGAGETAVREAHRRLMRAAHPDRGGSAWLAARLNAARDLLLGR
jgi:hypothetical protein